MNLTRKATTLRSVSIVVVLLACPDVPARRSCTSIQECQALLSGRSDVEERTLSTSHGQGPRPTRPIAIVGDGLAGIAAAANLSYKHVRVYGRTSYWLALTELPEVWQTNLHWSYEDAGLQPPSPSGGARLPRDSVILANLQNLVGHDVAYLATGSVTVTPGTGHTWTIIDADGHSESISELLIVGTGVLRPLRITDVIAGSDSVRRELMQAGKIGSGDDCVTIVPARVQVVGILGAGGSAADCVTAVLKKGGASEVVVWGSVDTSLMHSDAYDTVATRYASKICLIKDRATSVRFVNGAIVINDTAAAPCTNPARTGQRAGRIDFLVESLGRYSGDPPPVIASAAAGDSINYEPVLEPDTCALIGVRVTFSPRVAGVRDVHRPPIYLIGAAASWIPPGVGISAAGLARYKAGRDKTIAIVNHYNASGSARALTTESGPPSFAVAAYMGAHLARYLNNPVQSTSCHFAPQTPSSHRSGH